MKSCMNRSANGSLLECRELGGGGPEEVSSGGHVGCGYGLLVFW
jgi:hypothetical protein